MRTLGQEFQHLRRGESYAPGRNVNKNSGRGVVIKGCKSTAVKNLGDGKPPEMGCTRSRSYAGFGNKAPVDNCHVTIYN